MCSCLARLWEALLHMFVKTATETFLEVKLLSARRMEPGVARRRHVALTVKTAPNLPHTE